MEKSSAIPNRRGSPSKAARPAGDIHAEDSRSRVVAFLSRHYLWFLVIAGGVIIIEQAREHLYFAEAASQNYYVFVVEIASTIFLLGTISLLIRVLLSTLAEKTRALNILNVKHQFIQQLSASQTIPDVVRLLSQQIAFIVPGANIELFIHEAGREWFIRVNHQHGETEFDLPGLKTGRMSSYPCKQCLLKGSHSLRSLDACNRPAELAQVNQEDAGYCLPLVYGSSPVGLLLLYLPENHELDAEQSQMLTNLSAEMAQAVGLLVEKKAREEALLTEKIHNVQLDIARDLHDTVGQNISYLRMKLDHLSESDLEPDSDLIMEIRSMSKVANESYDLVRGTLAVLQAEDSTDLLYLFSRYAGQVADRTGFSIEFSTSGNPRSVSAARMRHLFYIFREALNNIEKHAHATAVKVKIGWEQEGLHLSVTDNGKGYDPSRTQKLDLHYGLRFMRERASILDGSLTVKSAEGNGTTILIQIPYD